MIDKVVHKVVLPLENDKSLSHHDERPTSLQIQISQAVLSNCRVGSKCSQTDILNDLQDFIGSRLYGDMNVFPNEGNDLHSYSNAAWLNDYSINHHQLQNLTKSDRTLYSRLQRDKNLPHQIWCFWCDQIWVEFSGVEKACDRPISFIDAFPLRIWIGTDVPYNESSSALNSVSTLSSDSVEIAEVATEFDEYKDVKYSKMNVVYDADIGRVDKETQSVHNHNRLLPSISTTGSASSSPGPRRRSLNNRILETSICSDSHDISPFHDNTRCCDILKDSQQCNDQPNLRTSLSENDLNISQSSDQSNYPSGSRNGRNSIDARVVSNYACGGPPPPYSDDLCGGKRKGDINASFSSLPPAYESLPEEVDPSSKNDISDFIEHDLDSSDLEHNASIALLMHTPKSVQIQLDHFQLLFLIRLSENFSAMMEKIEGDNEKANRELQLNQNVNEAVEQFGIVLNMMIPNVIIDLILSPCIGIDPIQTYNLLDRVRYETEKKENSNENLPLSVDRSDCLPMIRNCDAADSMAKDGNVGREAAEQTAASDPSYVANQTSTQSCTFDIEGSFLFASYKSSKDVLDPKSVPHTVSSGTSPNTMSTFSMSTDEYRSKAPNESNSMLDPYQETLSRPKETKLATTDDLESYDQTLKEVADIGVQVGDSMMDVNLKPRPEDQLISVLRIQVGKLFIGIEVEGKDSLLKISAETLQLNELGNMKYGKILDPRGIISEQIHEKCQVNMDSLTGNAVFRLRLGTGSYAEDIEKGSSESGFADIRINGLAAALLMSTIDNLQEFGEDEIVSPGLPFYVNVANSDITIYDDKPRRYKSAVKLPPSHVVVDDIFIFRSKDGVATIKKKLSKNDNSCVISNVEGESSQLGIYNATRNGNIIAESINQQVDALIGENSRLLEDLKVVNAKMNGLHTERDSLLKVIDKLQQELVFSTRENDDLHNRIRTLSLSRHQGHYV